MALRHLLRIERAVRIGGFSVKLGSLRRHFGGRDYTIAPINVLNWMKVYTIMLPLSAGKPLGEELSETLKDLPLSFVRALLPLFLSELPREKDVNQASMGQCLSVWAAFCEVNDLEYIQKAYETPGNQGKKSGSDAEKGIDFSDLAMFLCEKMGGSRLPDDYLRLPMQYFLSLFEGFKRLENVRAGRPADCDAPSEEEMTRVKDYFGGIGVGVQ
jgi:hypothetical protein